MNILIINGSPRKKGLISQMLGIMQEEAEKRGDTVEMVYTNDLTVKPCTGCMACRTKGKCVLTEDDSQRILKMMQQADATIYGIRELTVHNPARRTFLINLTWKFNEARSKYRGSGAGEKQKARM